jgi:ABC-type hemin transport system ATPase subunit
LVGPNGAGKTTTLRHHSAHARLGPYLRPCHGH